MLVYGLSLWLANPEPHEEGWRHRVAAPSACIADFDEVVRCRLLLRPTRLASHPHAIDHK